MRIKKTSDLKNKRIKTLNQEKFTEIKTTFATLFWEVSWFIFDHNLSFLDFCNQFSPEERILLENKMRKNTKTAFYFFGVQPFSAGNAYVAVAFLLITEGIMMVMPLPGFGVFLVALGVVVGIIAFLVSVLYDGQYPVVKYFFQRRKLVHFCGDKAVEEVIRHMESYKDKRRDLSKPSGLLDYFDD